MKETQRRFELGATYSTPGAIRSVHPEDMRNAFLRHSSCDWGDCCQEDAAENNFALDKHLRILSVFHDRNGTRFWIITEADRSATTILLPEEY